MRELFSSILVQVEIPEEDEHENKDEPTRNIEEIRRKNLEDNRAFLESLSMTKVNKCSASLYNIYHRLDS